jgi:predicted O-linked N-acetylglucosamine transferase (SPINDLY family)
MSDQALQCFEKAQTFKDARDFASARTWLEAAIELEPDFFQAHVNLSEACRILGDDSAAIQQLSSALKLKPDFYAGHNALGVLLQKKDDYKGAVAAFKKAIEYKPDFAEAYYNLGNCLRDVEKFDEAIACFRMASTLDPSCIEALSNLGEALQTTGRIDEAVQRFEAVIRIAPQSAMAFSNYLLTLNYLPSYGPKLLYEQHKRFDAAFGRTQDTSTKFANDCSPLRKLKIGYVSADFRNHPVSYFLEPFFSYCNKADFEIFCYSGARTQDAKTALFKRLSDHWTDVFDMTDTDFAATIRAHGIDILVDLSGHSADNRLPVFAQKAAPLQVTYLGYPNTSGLSAMDYRMTDGICDPPGEPVAHSEKLMRLSPCFCCYCPPQNAPAPGEVPFRQTGVVTFGSTHTLARLNDALLDLWAGLLSKIPSSRLLIMRTTLKGSGLDRVYKRFESRSVDRNRLVIQNTVPAGGHLAVYRDVDVFLDSFPWSGHTSACEALWMGVPVVTLRGDRHAGRMVASILSCLDMKDCIAGTKEEYLSVAREMAANIDNLETLRATLRDRMINSPLCDGQTFTANLEEAYVAMWREYCGKR